MSRSANAGVEAKDLGTVSRRKRIIAASVIAVSAAACGFPGDGSSNISPVEKAKVAANVTAYGQKLGQRLARDITAHPKATDYVSNFIYKGNTTVMYEPRHASLDIARRLTARANKDGQRPLLSNFVDVTYSVSPTSPLAEAGKLTVTDLAQSLNTPNALRVTDINVDIDSLRTDKQIAASKKHHLVSHEQQAISLLHYGFSAKPSKDGIDFNYFGNNFGLSYDTTETSGDDISIDLGELRDDVSIVESSVSIALDGPDTFSS